MQITKYGHSCILVETDGITILTDLGSWNLEVPVIPQLDAVLITHEHGDHFELEKLRALLAQHPDAIVITHAAVGAILDKEGIAYTGIEPGEAVDVHGISIESYGSEHAIIYGGVSPCRNTGYLIGERLFIPGDALHDIPPKTVEILALPTGGPWMKVAEAIDYAKAVQPKVAFPIHDAMYTEEYRQTTIPNWIGTQLEAAGIRFVNMGDSSSEDF